MTVSVEVPSALARAAISVAPLLIRLLPLNEALDTTLPIWSRREVKVAFRALRLLVSREVSEADRAVAFSWLSRSETEPPAAVATSMVDWARCSDCLTESRDREVARWFWAMAQMAPLSLAVATARPVLMRFWVTASDASVALRFCRAIRAPGLPFTLRDMVFVSYF